MSAAIERKLDLASVAHSGPRLGLLGGELDGDAVVGWTYVHEWPDVLDRTRSLVDAVLGGWQTAATPSRSRA